MAGLQVHSRLSRICYNVVSSILNVHLSPNRKMIFEEVGSGLYLFRNQAHVQSGNKISGYSSLILTEANLSDFNNNEIRKAEDTQNLHRAIAFPGCKKLF